MITSEANEKVRFARSLQRRRQRAREGKLLVEGVRLVEDAMRAGSFPALLFFQADRTEDERSQALLSQARAEGAGCYEVSEQVLRSLSETTTPQGIVAVVPLPRVEPPDNPDLVLIVDRVRDPGNLGTILRSSAAAGVQQVLLTRGTVAVYHARVLRAAMGAHFRLAMSWRQQWEEIAEQTAGLDVWVSDAHGELTYDSVEWTRPVALVIGGEADGPSGAARGLAQATVGIPMQGETESLNTAAATAVILFEAARQRRLSTIASNA